MVGSDCLDMLMKQVRCVPAICLTCDLLLLLLSYALQSGACMAALLDVADAVVGQEYWLHLDDEHKNTR